MNAPRENIPLGAEWINNVGVNGEGTSEDNIIINKSITSYDLDKTAKQKLDLSILSYFNLGANYQSTTSINYTNLTIYTVKDLSKTNLRSGQLILYEAIKADSISIKINKDIDAELKLKLDEKLKDLNIQSGNNFKDGITVSGEKLFLAYRVFELGKTKVKSKSVKIKDTSGGGGLREVKLMNYEVTLNYANLQKCAFPSQPFQYNEERFKSCEESTPIDVVIKNFNNTNINGMPLLKETGIQNNTYKSLIFTQRQNNKLITDYVEITLMIKDPNPPFFLYTDSKSKVLIKNLETPLKMLENPTAPGW